MLYAYIDGDYCTIDNLSLSESIGSVGKCTFDAPIWFFRDFAIADYRNLTYEVYFGDRPISIGIIESAVPAAKDGTVNLIKFSCATALSFLTKKSGDTSAVFQNASLAFIIDSLLRRVGGWTLGYMQDFDFTETFTLDVRSNNDVFSQIKAVVDKIPNYSLRYGGTFEGDHRLDVGPLGDASGASFSQGHTLSSIKRLPPSTRLIYEIEGFGGSAGSAAAREVYLKDASDGVPGLLTDPDYPVVAIGDGTYVVRDLVTTNAATNGDSTIKRYANVKPDSDTPTTGEIEEAGFALYKTCVNELIKNNNQGAMYDVEASISSAIFDQATSSYDTQITLMTGYDNSNQDSFVDIENSATNKTRLGQTFQINDTENIQRARMWLKKTGVPPGVLTATIHTDSGGSPSGSPVTNGTSATITASLLTTSGFWIDFDFSDDVALTANTTYWLVLSTNNPPSLSNYVSWGADASAPAYAGGEMYSEVSSSWSAESADAIFEILKIEEVLLIGTALESEYVLQEPVFDILPGSTVGLNGSVKIPVLDNFLGTIEWIKVYTIDTNERVANVSLNLGSNKNISVKVKTGALSPEELYDTDVIMAEAVKENNQSILGAPAGPPVEKGVEVVTVTHTSVGPDEVMTDGRDAKQFVFAMPSVPGGSTVLRFSLFSNVTSAEIETTTAPALPSTGWTGNLTIGDGWNTQNGASITGVFIFS